MLKVLGIIAAAVVVLLGAFLFIQQETPTPPVEITPLVKVGNLNIYQGQVEIVRNNEIKTGATGSEIYSNDLLKIAPASRASIILKDGSTIRLEAGTEVKVVRENVFDLKTGKIWSSVKPLPEGAEFSVETPATVAIVRGTEFNVSYLNSITEIFVDQDSENDLLFVYLKIAPENLQPVAAGQFFKLRDATLLEDFKAGPVPAPKEIIDAWISFNRNLSGIKALPEIKIEPQTKFESPSVIKPVIKQAPQKEAAPLPPPAPTPAPTLEPTKKLIGVSLSYQKIYRESAQIAYQSSLPNAQFTATANYSDGSSADVTKLTQWSVAAGTANGQISSAGFYQPRQAGTDTVVGVFENQKAAIDIDIP